MTAPQSGEEDDELGGLRQRGAPGGPRPLDAKARLRAELGIDRPSALDPLGEGLLAVATTALAAGDVAAASEALEGLLDVVPADHPKRRQVESFAALVRALAASRTAQAGERSGDRAPKVAEVVDPALSAGYLLMAAQDGELTAEEAATLEERLGPADAALRIEWSWLERARGALGRVATFEPAGDDPVWSKLRAGIHAGLDRPVEGPRPKERTAREVIEALKRKGVSTSTGDRASELERMRFEMEQSAAEMRALLNGLAGSLAGSFATQAPMADPDVARQLRAQQTSLADQLRRSIGSLGSGRAKDFDLSPEAAAALFASSTDEVPTGPPSGPSRAVRTGRVVGSLEVATLHLPAATPFGDLVDVTDHPGGVDVVLLDPSGRGPDARAAALATQVGLQAALAVGATPTAAIAAVNRLLVRSVDRGTFVSGTLLRWDEARGVATIAGAGGEAAVVRRARRGGGAEVERVKVGGVVLAAVTELPAFPPREVELAPGDALLLVSDGVTEQPGLDGSPYCDAGWSRLLRLVTAFGHLEAAALVVTLEAELRAWGTFSAGGPADDVVIVALRRRPTR